MQLTEFNMIADTIKLLQSGNWYGCGEYIEIAKGSNSIPKRWSEVKEQIKRARLCQSMRRL